MGAGFIGILLVIYFRLMRYDACGRYSMNDDDMEEVMATARKFRDLTSRFFLQLIDVSLRSQQGMLTPELSRCARASSSGEIPFLPSVFAMVCIVSSIPRAM